MTPHMESPLQSLALSSLKHKKNSLILGNLASQNLKNVCTARVPTPPTVVKWSLMLERDGPRLRLLDIALTVWGNTSLPCVKIPLP